MKFARVLALVALAAVFMAACGNPRASGTQPTRPVTPTQSDAPSDPAEAPRVETVRIVPARVNGDRFRTVRNLRVDELTEDGTLSIESEEVTLTRVLRVDESGRMLAVRRSYESVATRVSRGGGRYDEAHGELHGCTLELTQQMSGVEARVLAGDARVGRQQIVIEGFDTALLPMDPVSRGADWVLDGTALSGLNRIIESMDFKIDRNRMQCHVLAITSDQVLIGLDWRINGEYRSRPALLRFTGELRFDRRDKLVTEFSLTGGRLGQEGPDRQVEIRVQRRIVDGWLDLDR